MEIHFAYEDGDSDYGHIDVTDVDIILFAKPNGSMNHLMVMRVLKK